jgi:hypothetical protein
MNILFIGTTGIYHTLIAAHLYLGKPEPDNFNNIKFWGNRSEEALGYPLFVDYDEQRNRVYSLGVGRNVPMATKSIKQLLEILNCTESDLIVKPVYIKRERLLLFLHQIGRFKLIQHLLLPIIGYILKIEFASINQQVKEFISVLRGRSV